MYLLACVLCFHYIIVHFYRHLTQEGIDTISENGLIQDVNVLSKRALDVSIQPLPNNGIL